MSSFWDNSILSGRHSCLHTVFNRRSNNEKKISRFDSNQPLGPIIGIFCTEYLIIFLHMSVFNLGRGRIFSIHDKTVPF